MAKLFDIGNNPLDSILPVYGQPRVKTPIWNESQNMFITDQYTSASGNTYYLGVRFSDRFVTILHIGLYHSWTYINDVEVYAFDGEERKLVGKVTLDKFYDEALVRETTEHLLLTYIEGQMLLQGIKPRREELQERVQGLVQKSYCSMLDDSATVRKLEAVKPLLIAKK